MNNSEKSKSMLPNDYKDNNPYVYHLIDNGAVVYVGQTSNIKTRIEKHLSSKEFAGVLLLDCINQDMDSIEKSHILSLTPKYNKKDNPLYSPPIIEYFDDEHTELRMAVIKGAKDIGIDGVVNLSKHCGLSYERTVRVWKGDNNAKIADVITVLSSVGLKLRIETISKGEG